jgi:hypothetical protein
MCVDLESVPAGAGLFFYLGLNIVRGMKRIVSSLLSVGGAFP